MLLVISSMSRPADDSPTSAYLDGLKRPVAEQLELVQETCVLSCTYFYVPYAYAVYII